MFYHRNVNATLNPRIAIPATKQGLATSFNCRLPGSIVDAKISLDINHPNTSDLTITLVSPKGTPVQLHNRSGNAANLRETYSGDALRVLRGQEAEGNWTLQVVDAKGAGALNSWRIELELGRDVQSVIYVDKNVGTSINGSNGVASVISVPASRSAAFRTDNMRIHLDIERTFITDLDIRLKTPTNKVIALNAKEGWTKRGSRWTLAGSQLKELAGQNLNGDYTLSVAQGTSKEGGTLARWAIEFMHDSDINRVSTIDTTIATSLMRAGVNTKAALSAAVPLEISSILALRKHDNAVPLAHKLVPNRSTA